MTKDDGQIHLVKEDLAGIKSDLKYILKRMDEMNSTLKEALDKQDKQDNRITSLETKTGVVGTISIAFTTIAASIAAWLGVRN